MINLGTVRMSPTTATTTAPRSKFSNLFKWKKKLQHARNNSTDRLYEAASASIPSSIISVPSPTLSISQLPLESLVDESKTFSVVPSKKLKLSITSPTDMIPKTWQEYNTAYQNGDVDFEYPPAPPTDLADADVTATIPTGQYRSPSPLNEKERQRSVNALGICPPANKRPGSLSTQQQHRHRSSSLFDASFTDIAVNFPKDVMDHPALRNLALEARMVFGTSISTVSIMSDNEQIFLAQTGLGTTTKLDRVNTACSHAMLKAANNERDPFVVLDLSEDWRFEHNNFGSSKFYASSPIYAAPPFGDKSNVQSYPVGIFCILDHEPRAVFDEADRLRLMEMADDAGIEIARWREAQRVERIRKMNGTREIFRKRTGDTRVLDPIQEVRTPGIDEVMDPISISIKGVVSKCDARRGSNSSDTSSFSALLESDLSPCYTRRRKGRNGSHVTYSKTVPDTIQSTLDIATKLIGETLDLSFTCVVRCDLNKYTQDSPPRSIPPLQMLSSHNLPVPTFFDYDLHESVFLNDAVGDNALLFVDPDFKEDSGDYSTGIVVSIGVTAGGIGLALSGYSDDRSRVLNREDFLFFRSFASNLRKYVAQIA